MSVSGCPAERCQDIIIIRAIHVSIWQQRGVSDTIIIALTDAKRQSVEFFLFSPNSSANKGVNNT